DFFALLLTQPAGASGSFSLGQTTQSLLLETVNPVLDGTRCVPQKPCYFRAGHTLRDQQNAMQPVIAARLVRTLDLLLQAKHRHRIRYHQWPHDSRRSRFTNDAQLLMTLCLAANIYLNEIDWFFDAIRRKTAEGDYEAVNYHRFADDIVITVSGHHTKRGWAERALQRLQEQLALIGVELNREKTKMVNTLQGEAFGFLAT